ncbi:MAG: diphosphokinase / guanosine-3,5-bis(diphosphate) 3-diphosphatase, partial [Chloroflexota bacterium]|nr:diphosphokinase / guanosine-3,5-bis(diphosphate) 3-diphosphatase [Chloroflexota bacterium]
MAETAVDDGIDRLLANVAGYLPPTDVGTVQRAYEVASSAHGDQRRATGDPYVTHPIAVASILADLHLDTASITAALLHDVVEDTSLSLADIERDFGPEITRIVDGVTKLDRVQWVPGDQRLDSKEAEWAENLRKMFLAMAEDLRVVLVKLADRLHNMRTLQPLRPDKQRRIAQETMEIYAPLANRLGIWEIKWQLEDLSFRYLEPEAYKQVARAVQDRRGEREHYIRKALAELRMQLQANGITAEVYGRPKHLYSVYNKMHDRATDISQIYDLLAIRVIVETLPECYNALGIVHALWHPLPGQFDDYIASPKESGYQSLHTTVVALEGRPLEIQIRTKEMHQVAEFGVAAHWRYKEGRRRDPVYDEKIAWLRQLMDWQKDVLGGAQGFVDALRNDVFQQQVYVFTPKGEIKELPAGSTSLDFAYRIHTEVGHHCVGAKVNGRLVSFDRELQNGDIVEIITSKASRGPSRDWLMPAFGYVKTNHAREKIRQYFRREAREESITRGRDLVAAELKRLGLTDVSLEQVAEAFRYDKLDDFFAAMGYGDVHPQQIAGRVTTALPQPEPQLPPATSPAVETTGGVRVDGVGDLFTRLARCCTPVPGDPIIGFITRGRGITVHRSDCSSVLNEDEPERLVAVQWGSSGKDAFPVTMHIVGYDREGLVRDIAAVVADEKLSISGLNVAVQRDQTAVLTATLNVPDIEKLSRVMARIQGVRDVLSVER